MARDWEHRVDSCRACGAERVEYGEPDRPGTFKRFDEHVRKEHTAEDFGLGPFEPEAV